MVLSDSSWGFLNVFIWTLASFSFTFSSVLVPDHFPRDAFHSLSHFTLILSDEIVFRLHWRYNLPKSPTDSLLIAAWCKNISWISLDETTPLIGSFLPTDYAGSFISTGTSQMIFIIPMWQILQDSYLQWSVLLLSGVTLNPWCNSFIYATPSRLLNSFKDISCHCTAVLFCSAKQPQQPLLSWWIFHWHFSLDVFNFPPSRARLSFVTAYQ